ncbi:MAG: pilus assembly protein [Atopobiaceae bacterium]|jgi:hypothetical protein|nr:pilus assembly protein [Atopobiaceae bacterium]
MARGEGELDGQASVEAALLLPVAMALVALLVQPVCLLYTRSVMESSAAEGVRALATASGSGGATAEACERFVRRRLAAVPELSCFHVGGEDDWTVSCEGAEGEASCSVSIAGHARPLPSSGWQAGVLGGSDDSGIVLEVEVSEDVRPSWLKGTYGEWVGMWDA